MSDVIVMTFHALWRFIKKPVELSEDKASLLLKIGTCGALFLIQIPPLLVLMALVGGLEQLGLWDEDMHSLQKIFQEMEPVLIFFFAVIMAPLLEEVMFRLILRFRSNFLILWSIHIGVALHLGQKRSLLKTARKVWDKFYGRVFYLMTMAFGLMHIMNFEPSLNIYLLAPILVAPQILIGINLGYLRVRFGLIWSILFHAFYNGVLMSIALLTGEI
ncbi:CPBP family intramembrane metalloprotease [Cyclobacteriaceae bacterium]|nr:CPBP family intramembrane metalloprotease [Cyclobacteriaceae bacterium]